MAPPSTVNLGTVSSRRRSLSGASALLTRRFTRSGHNSTPRSASATATVSTKRRATLDATAAAATSSNSDINQKTHVRIVPSIDNPSRSLIFDIVDRDLEIGSVIRIGRYSERHTNINCMSFKSKVVSRCHCEIWVETDGKLYIRDTKSSSGTFLNHVRLSPAGSESKAVQLNDGDIVQLGVDFQGGREEMYRSVKMKFELNRSRRERPLSFNLHAFQNLRNLTQQHNLSTTPPEETQSLDRPDTPLESHEATPPADESNRVHSSTIIHSHTLSVPHEDVEECCICLYALAPFQALFVSPCSHTYHYKCIRPLLMSYPGFQCPICRTYSDLEASVAIEADEVVEKYRQPYMPTPPVDSGLDLQSPPSNITESAHMSVVTSEHLGEPPSPLSSNISPMTDTFSPIQFDSPDLFSENSPDSSHSENIEGRSIEENPEQTTNNNPAPISRQHTAADVTNPKRRERRSSQFMEKLKMVFFEKRKSPGITIQPQNKQRKHNNNIDRPRPLSYPNLLPSAMDEIPPVPTPSRVTTSTRINNNIPSTSSNIPLEFTSQSRSCLNDIQEDESLQRSFVLDPMMIDT